MGKHKNARQIALFIEFMEQHEDIAKGYTKRDKTLVEALWTELVDSLNAAGPPSKDIAGWKKVWTEWKSDVKKKLANNREESRATGGGPCTKYVLTQTEEAIARLCAISRAVEGIPGESLGDDAVEIEIDEEMPCTSSQRRVDMPSHRQPKTKTSIPAELSNFLDSDEGYKKDLNQNLSDLVAIQRENASSLRRLYHSVENSSDALTTAMTDFKNSFDNLSTLILTALQERNEIEREQLNLELLKFDIERKKNNENNFDESL